MEYQSGAVSPVGSIQEGWNIIKNDYWIFFLMTLVAIVILIAASFILGLVNNVIVFGVSSVLGIAAKDAGDAGKISAAVVPQLIAMFISLFTNIIVLTVSGALFCGIYSALARKVNTGIVEFGDLFSGFQQIQSCLIVGVILSIVQFIISVGFLLVGAAVGISAFGMGMLMKDGKLDPSVFGGLFLVIFLFVIAYIIINFIVSALTTFVYPLISQRNLSGGQALMLSVKGALGNIGGLIGLLLLLGLMSIGGFLVCLVGILFVIPILSASIFAAYQSVFGKTGGSYQQNPPPPPNFGGQRAY